MSVSKHVHEHPVSLSLSIIQAVEPTTKPLPFYETTRNNRRKRIYESLKPLHHFHLEYQLVPGQDTGSIYRTDIVTYGIVAKIFTEQDERVVNTWNENGLTYYGWRHSHNLTLTLKSLLDLYDHTLKVRLWNNHNKLSARAKYDRPKAFRLPAPKKHDHDQSEDSEGLTSSSSRPQRLPGVYHTLCPTSRQARRKSRRPSELIESIDSGEDIVEHFGSPPKSLKIPTITEEVETLGDKVVLELNSSAPEVLLSNVHMKETIPVLPLPQVLPSISSMTCSTSVSPGLKGISRRRLQQLQLEAAEKARIDKEGVVILSIKLADLFASHTSVTTSLKEGVANLKDFEISLCLETPLMSEEQRQTLNPMTVTVKQCHNLPPMSSAEYNPAYVSYQFYDKPKVCTQGLPYSPHISWNMNTVLLLGTIESDLLLEYLRGPPLIFEVHDRDERNDIENAKKGVVFGHLSTDQIIGTCAYRTEPVVETQSSSFFGEAKLDLSSLLCGLTTMTFMLPILNPCSHFTRVQREVTTSAENFPDYLHYGSHLSVQIEITYPLNYPPLPVTIGDNLLSLRPHTPFGRLIYIVSANTPTLAHKVLTLVNEINITGLDLEDLPVETRDATLSTYKLTHEQMTSPHCDIITGCHIEDRVKHIFVLEGLHWKGLKRIWDQIPHHHSEDESVLKTFYNSDYTFSSRLYGNLDVDLTHIILPHPLGVLVQEPRLYIRETLPQLSFIALMNLHELELTQQLSDVTRNGMYPTVEMITSLSLYCSQMIVSPTINEQGNEVPLSPEVEESTKRRRRTRSWEPLNNSNSDYEKLVEQRKQAPVVDWIMHNIMKAHRLSEGVNKTKRPHHKRSMSVDTNKSVFLYSSQTYNSTVLSKDELRQYLMKTDPQSRYTYCQSYHSMTVEPDDWEDNIKKYWQRSDRRKWKTKDGFIYPGPKTSLESNKHINKPDQARIEELQQSFVDNQLHGNTLRPTVNWMQYSWNERASDFERYKSPPIDFGVHPPVTIHLAGDSRQKELKSYDHEDQKKWRAKLVVNDTQFYVLRQGQKELRIKGPSAATQQDKLKGLLKDPPMRPSLAPNDLTPVNTIPYLSVIRDNEREVGVVGYLPGPQFQRSLKRDCNVIPIKAPLSPPQPGLHRANFQLYYNSHTHSLNNHPPETRVHSVQT